MGNGVRWHAAGGAAAGRWSAPGAHLLDDRGHGREEVGRGKVGDLEGGDVVNAPRIDRDPQLRQPEPVFIIICIYYYFLGEPGTPTDCNQFFSIFPIFPQLFLDGLSMACGGWGPGICSAEEGV